MMLKKIKNILSVLNSNTEMERYIKRDLNI